MHRTPAAAHPELASSSALGVDSASQAASFSVHNSSPLHAAHATSHTPDAASSSCASPLRAARCRPGSTSQCPSGAYSPDSIRRTARRSTARAMRTDIMVEGHSARSCDARLAMPRRSPCSLGDSATSSAAPPPTAPTSAPAKFHSLSAPWPLGWPHCNRDETEACRKQTTASTRHTSGATLKSSSASTTGRPGARPTAPTTPSCMATSTALPTPDTASRNDACGQHRLHCLRLASGAARAVLNLGATTGLASRRPRAAASASSSAPQRASSASPASPRTATSSPSPASHSSPSSVLSERPSSPPSLRTPALTNDPTTPSPADCAR
mmetsp:Transcript_15795/g.59860  ORF Transcript_15795/g.59860 Transcript_15795/m.59860 type:complete len:326 (+) Transcript_15795:218-1195(+)